MVFCEWLWLKALGFLGVQKRGSLNSSVFFLLKIYLGFQVWSLLLKIGHPKGKLILQLLIFRCEYVCFHPYLGKWWNLTNIFQMGWNHQPLNLGIPNRSFVNGYGSRHFFFWVCKKGDHWTYVFFLLKICLGFQLWSFRMRTHWLDHLVPSFKLKSAHGAVAQLGFKQHCTP